MYGQRQDTATTVADGAHAELMTSAAFALARSYP